MAARTAIDTGMYLATLGDSKQNLKLGNIRTKQGRNFQTSLPEKSLDASVTSLGSLRRRKRGKGLKRQRGQHSIDVPNALTASLQAASKKTYRTVEKTLMAKIHKFTYRKAMIPMWKMLARFRTLTTFTPDQMRQFLYGVALTMHMFTKYNRRATNLHQQMKSVFLLVFLPFSIPPLVVVVIPSLIFLLPLMIVVTAFTALNRKAKMIMEKNRKPRDFDVRQTVFGRVGSTLAMGGSVVLQAGEFTGNMASSVAGGVAGGIGESIRLGNEMMSVGASTASSIGRQSSKLLKRRKSFLKYSGRTEAPLAPAADASESQPSLSSVSVSATNISAQFAAAEAATANSSNSCNGMILPPHPRSSNKLTCSSLTNSWDLELVSSFESSDSNNSSGEHHQRQHLQPTTHAQAEQRPHHNLDPLDTSTRSLVDTTPMRQKKKSSPWWRTSSNDTPTTNNTEPSASSIRPTSAFARRSSKRANKQMRRVSFAAVEEVDDYNHHQNYNTNGNYNTSFRHRRKSNFL